MTPLVSFIIPIYNSERYIRTLLDKLNKQVKDNIEIILIDDGSKDLSANICVNYKESNEKFKFFSQENRGASSARNNGINNARGEYIVFLDSDDFIADNYVQTICDLCKDSDADIIQFDYYYGSEEKGYKLNRSDLSEGIISYDIYYKFLIMQKSNQPWNKIYKRKIIQEHKILFDTTMILGEDLLFTINVMEYAKKIEIVHTAIYYYYLNNINSICSNVGITYLNDLDNLYSAMKKSIESKNMSKDVYILAQNYMEISFFRAIGLCINNGCELHQIDERIKKISSIYELSHIKYMGIANKARSFLIKRKAYRLIAKIVKLKH